MSSGNIFLKNQSFPTRLWTYARSGYIYVTFPINIAQTALLVKLVFPAQFVPLSLIGGSAVFLLAIFFGRLHYKSLLYRTDQTVGVLNNQYTWTPTPGLWQDAVIPALHLLVYNSPPSKERDNLVKILQHLEAGKDIRELLK